MGILQRFRKSKKYEVDVVGYCKSGFESEGEEFEKMQDQGWEIAGEIKVDKKFHDVTFLLIPMKRKIK